MGQSRQPVWPATLLRTILQPRVPKVTGTTGEMNMGLSDNLSLQILRLSWLIIIVSYIYTHKHIFQSRTVNIGVCRPIFRPTHINDFRICVFIFFVPFPAIGEGRRTSTNVRYLGGRWPLFNGS